MTKPRSSMAERAPYKGLTNGSNPTGATTSQSSQPKRPTTDLSVRRYTGNLYGGVMTNYDPKAKYYSAGEIETLDIIKAKLTSEQYKGFLLGNILKYNCRLNFKHPATGGKLRDVEKTAVYTNELQQILLNESVAETKKINSEYQPGGGDPDEIWP